MVGSGIDRVRVIFACVVIVVWVASVVLAAIDRTYKPDTYIDLGFMAVAAFLLGPVVTKRKNGNEK